MHKKYTLIPFLFSLVLLLAACKENRQNPEEESVPYEPTEEEIAEAKVAVDFGFPQHPNESVLIIPVYASNESRKSAGLLSGLKSSRDGDYGYSEEWAYSGGMGQCENLLFVHKKSRETHLLSEEKLKISSYYFPSTDSLATHSLPEDFLFTLRNEDFDGNKVLNSLDPLALYTADSLGQKLTRLSPRDAHLIEWEVNKEDERIYMKSILDSNGDKKFNELDERIFTYVSFYALFRPEILVDQDQLKQTRDLLKKQWRKLEE